MKNDISYNDTISIWIGGVASEERFKKLMSLGDNQVAANNMQLLYINGIEKNINKKLLIINGQFLPSYPKSPVFFYKKECYKNSIDVAFLNLPILKQLFKIINIYRETKKILLKKENLSKKCNIYVYSMTSSFMNVSKMLKKNRKFKNRIQIIQIVPDLPEYMNFEKKNIIFTILKKIDTYYLYKLTKFIDKYILFSKYMALKLKIDEKQYLVIEGMVESNVITKKEKIKNNKKVIMYAGGINKKYGIYNLINAFKITEKNDFELHLYGYCSDPKELAQTIGNNNSIKYYGMKPRNEILEKEKEATILINPRNNIEEFAKYSFPSKTFEFLLSGVPVMMYKLDSIPTEYDKHIIYIKANTIEKLSKELEKVMSTDTEKLAEFGKKAQKFIIEKKNNILQTKKMLDFISK